MRLSLPNMAEVVSPLRVLLERKPKSTTRIKRVASRKVISEEDWSEEIRAAWQGSGEVFGICGAAQLSQAGLLLANVSGRK